MKSITEGPFQNEQLRDTLTEGVGCTLHLGREPSRVFADLFQLNKKDRNNATVQDGRVVVQDVRGRYNANNQGRPFQRNNARGNVEARNAGGQNRDGNVNPVKLNPLILDEEQLLFLAGEQVTNFDDDVDDPNEKDLALNVDHIFEADQCDAFEFSLMLITLPNKQTMIMENRFILKIQSTMKSGHQYESEYFVRGTRSMIPL
ncbi:hypothetical protein Tco_1505544 [Tanacetum coccineum]